MMNLLPELMPYLDVENLFATTTYRVDREHRCAYCHVPLEGYFVDYGKQSFYVHQCLCSDAQDELIVKQGILSKIAELENVTNRIDLPSITPILYEQELKKLQNKYQVTHPAYKEAEL